MRWKGRRQSTNVEDRRGQSASYASAGAAPMVLRLLPALVRTKVGRVLLIGGIAIFFGSRLLGIDLLPLLLGGGSPGSAEYQATPQERELAEFAAVILGDTEQTWGQLFSERGGQYREPTLVLFTGRVNSACGMASSAVGPFYCPADQQLYLDFSFFDDLANRHGAPGDFAQAYVIAHEVGHHVQTLLGISEEVRRQSRGRPEAEVNALSVRQELQADCFAGLWGHYANVDRQMLDPDDLAEALAAASAIGDDRLQREAGASVVPDSFTHGSSAQRVEWFTRGFESGRLESCDTFAAAAP